MSVLGAIDQGTSSSRFLLFSAKDLSLIASHQIELKQSFPHEGWVEMDAEAMLEATRDCIRKAMDKFKRKESGCEEEVAGVGLANQRESAVVWDSRTGAPLYPAIIWLDVRAAHFADQLTAASPTKSTDAYQDITGLPLNPYFTAFKLHWLIHNVPSVKAAMEQGTLMAGTVDTWLIWNLTGGVNGGAFITDVTNASHTMLMNIHTLQWDPKMLDLFGIRRDCLGEIRSSAEVYGLLSSTGTGLDGARVAGCLGDQQAALVGQACLGEGMAKATYGTGCFLLYNTGTRPVLSKHGLLTTVAFQMGPEAAPFYALEGSVAAAGAAVRWLRNNLEIINSSAEVESLAGAGKRSAGVYFVPAFSGLYAPHWDSTARGAILGLSFATTKAEIARAALEAVAWQTREILDAMGADLGTPFTRGLRVDGGMTANALLMQTQADLGTPFTRGLRVDGGMTANALLMQTQADLGTPFTRGLRVDGGMTANALLMQTQADLGTPFTRGLRVDGGMTANALLMQTQADLGTPFTRGLRVDGGMTANALLMQTQADLGTPFTRGLRVDGGMTANALLMQTQADVLGGDVLVSQEAESTALGAAVAAGIALQLWSLEEYGKLERRYKKLSSELCSSERESGYRKWQAAVERAKGWTTIL